MTALPRLNWALLAILVVGGAFLRFSHLDFAGRMPCHPDEPITVEVVSGMRERGDWNANWRLAELDAHFRYDQFNFSGYLIATRLLAPAAEWCAGPLEQRPDRGIVVYRTLSAILGVVCIVLAWLLGRNIGGAWTAAFAAAGTAMAVILVQDSHYARPESFGTCLFIATAWLCGRRSHTSTRAIVGASFLVGILAMTKVTLACAAIFPLWAWCRSRQGGVSRQPCWVAIAAVVALLGGLWLAAPGAWADPAALLRGVQHLRNQYATTHPPHSLPDHGRVLGLQLAYFTRTLGLVTAALAFVGIVVALVQRRWTVLVTVIVPTLATAGYFATQRVFFERNLSHVVPLYFVTAGLGLAAIADRIARNPGRRWLASAVAGVVFAAALVPSARLTYRFVGEDLSGDSIARQRTYSLGVFARCAAGSRIYSTTLLSEQQFEQTSRAIQSVESPVLVMVIDFNDAYTAHFVQRLTERFGVMGTAHFAGLYPDLPVCTLQTYHACPIRYFLVGNQTGD